MDLSSPETTPGRFRGPATVVAITLSLALAGCLVGRAQRDATEPVASPPAAAVDANRVPEPPAAAVVGPSRAAHPVAERNRFLSSSKSMVAPDLSRVNRPPPDPAVVAERRHASLEVLEAVREREAATNAVKQEPVAVRTFLSTSKSLAPIPGPDGPAGPVVRQLNAGALIVPDGQPLPPIEAAEPAFLPSSKSMAPIRGVQLEDPVEATVSEGASPAPASPEPAARSTP